jgi:hypothetical protein
MTAFHEMMTISFSARHSADTSGPEVVVFGLDASETAETLVPGFLPFGNQCSIGELELDTELVALSGDGLLPEEHVEHVSGHLVVNTEDGPERLVHRLPVGRLGLGYTVRGERKRE